MQLLIVIVTCDEWYDIYIDAHIFFRGSSPLIGLYSCYTLFMSAFARFSTEANTSIFEVLQCPNLSKLGVRKTRQKYNPQWDVCTTEADSCSSSQATKPAKSTDSLDCVCRRRQTPQSYAAINDSREFSWTWNCEPAGTENAQSSKTVPLFCERACSIMHDEGCVTVEKSGA